MAGLRLRPNLNGAYVAAYIVTGYGAKGDNVTDDTAAIQAAIAACQTAGGGTVYFPPGTYLTSAALNVTAANVTLRAAGWDSIINANFRDVANAYVQFTGAAINGSVESLRIDGPGDGSKSQAAIQIGNSSGAVGSITGVRVRDCYLYNVPGHGVILGPEAFDCHVVDNRIEKTGCTDPGILDGHGVTIEGSGNVVSRNRIVNPRMRGIELFQSGSEVVQNCVVSNNVITGAGTANSVNPGVAYGIVAAGCSQCKIDNNSVIGGSTVGIYLGLGQGVYSDMEITGNTVMRNTYGILADTNGPARDLLIAHNLVAYNTLHGIQVKGVSGTVANSATITGNQVYRNGVAGSNIFGIYCTYVTDLNVTANTVMENGYGGSANNGAGIYLDTGVTNATVTGNRCGDAQATKTQQYGIQLNGTVDYITISGNNCVGNGHATLDIKTVTPTTTGSITLGSNGGRSAVIWTGVTYTNSWANFGSGYFNTSYTKDGTGVVHIEGVMASGTAATSAFTLPAGFRPSANLIFAVMTNSGIGRVDVKIDGTVNHVSGGTTFFSLCNVQFMAEA